MYLYIHIGTHDNYIIEGPVRSVFFARNRLLSRIILPPEPARTYVLYDTRVMLKYNIISYGSYNTVTTPSIWLALK